MKKILKKATIVLIGIGLVVYVAGKMNIFPTKIIEDESQEFVQKIEEIKEGTEEKSTLRKVFDGLDAGKESKASKDEITDATEFEKTLECFTVTEVVDGDTIWVKNDSNPNGIKVRYIGIDTPESAHSDETKNTKEGKISFERNFELISAAQDEIYLEYDIEKEDQYGRTLAYVYTYDWDNEEYIRIEDVLLSEGLCKVLPVEPNTKYKDHFNELMMQAKKDKKGFFGTGFYD